MPGFVDHLLQQPLWVQVWVAWMGVVNLASVLFVRHREARWTLAAFAGSFICMNALFTINGFNRLLGLTHVIFWTPPMFYLGRRRQTADSSGGFRLWLGAVLGTIGLSLVIDYVDVARYLAGDR